jgi:hypothetical protein
MRQGLAALNRQAHLPPRLEQQNRKAGTRRINVPRRRAASRPGANDLEVGDEQQRGEHQGLGGDTSGQRGVLRAQRLGFINGLNLLFCNGLRVMIYFHL